MFWNKPKKIYGDFLKQSLDVIGKKPALTERLAEDMDLELYLGDSGKGKNTWVTAVILVRRDKDEYRTKYDSGGMVTSGFDLKSMAAECKFHIFHSWGLESLRQLALSK